MDSGWYLFLFVVVLCKCAEAAEYTLYKDASQPITARVEDLLARMTLEEKIGQMTQIERSVATADVMTNYYIGSVLSGGGSVPAPQASPATWMNMVDGLQKGAMSTRLQIPMIYGIDAVHGHNNVYGATIFPHNVGLGATRDPDLAKRIGAATALEIRATGIQYTFAPCVAVCRDPRWGRCYESYSEDPTIVKAMTEIIFGLQGQPPANSTKGVPYIAGQSNVAACAKHFVGDGGTTDGVDENNTVSNYKQLVDIHMTPYFDAIVKGVSTIMVSYSSWNGMKMHANRFLISHVLKKQLRFKGFVISDWQGIDRITNPPNANYSLSVFESVGAGIDMVMVPYNFADFINDLTLQVKGGFIPMSRINDAVQRILTVKFTLGLFEHPMSDPSLANQLGSKEHRDLAREAVRKSLVLLKNGKSASETLLPLNKNAPKILVAGTHPDNLGYQCGGWTMEWQGLSGNSTIGTTILSAIQSAVSSSTEVVYQQNPDANYVKGQAFSYAIVVVGEAPYAEMFGDNLNLTIPLGGGDTINNVCGSLKCLVILISGRPLVIGPYLPLVDAFVAAWLPGTEGQGVTDVIFGDYGFQGKLPRTWFKSADQLPMSAGDEHYDPLFPLNFGLTTTVAAENLRSSFGVLSKEIPGVLSMITILCLHMYIL
jgi:beta-glucosidase